MEKQVALNPDRSLRGGIYTRYTPAGTETRPQ